MLSATFGSLLRGLEEEKSQKEDISPPPFSPFLPRLVTRTPSSTLSRPISRQNAERFSTKASDDESDASLDCFSCDTLPEGSSEKEECDMVEGDMKDAMLKLVSSSLLSKGEGKKCGLDGTLFLFDTFVVKAVLLTERKHARRKSLWKAAAEGEVGPNLLGDVFHVPDKSLYVDDEIGLLSDLIGWSLIKMERCYELETEAYASSSSPLSSPKTINGTAEERREDPMASLLLSKEREYDLFDTSFLPPLSSPNDVEYDSWEEEDEDDDEDDDEDEDEDEQIDGKDDEEDEQKKGTEDEGWENVTTFEDEVIGLLEAVASEGLLHVDPSIQNMMRTENTFLVLVDWENCAQIELPKGKKGKKKRRGGRGRRPILSWRKNGARKKTKSSERKRKRGWMISVLSQMMMVGYGIGMETVRGRGRPKVGKKKEEEWKRSLLKSIRLQMDDEETMMTKIDPWMGSVFGENMTEAERMERKRK